MRRHHTRSMAVALAVVLSLALAAPAVAQQSTSSGDTATPSSPDAAATSPSAHSGPDGELAPLLVPDTGEAIPGHYIVVFKEGAEQADIGAARAEARAHGGEVTRSYDTAVSGFAATLPAAAVKALRADPRVAYVEADVEVAPAWSTQTPAPWGLDRVDQRDLPLDDRYVFDATGQDVTAYIIDSGIYFGHTEFTGRAVPGFTAIPDGLGAADCIGHGTHVTGVVGGVTFGAAKQADLVSVRVIDCNAVGTLSGVIGGIDWVTANHAAPAVATLALGGPPSQVLDDAVATSVASGVTYAIAAGNSNSNACNFSPAREASALTVGGTTPTDERATWSNWGPCVDLFAPGASITSAWLGSPSATNTLSGTSASAAAVAGVAALYLEDNPSASPAMVRDAILGTGTAGVLSDVGAGSPNLLLFSRLHDGHCAYDQRYSGTLPRGGSQTQPPGGYYAGSGWHHGCVVGDDGVDVELRLLGWSGWNWQTIAVGDTPGNVQDVSAPAGAGLFIWTVSAVSGSGDYDFTLSPP